MRAKLFSILAGLVVFAVFAEPVRSNTGGVGVDVAEKWEPTALDYVQDGLIAFWDGIENAGWGVDDKSVDYWEELISGTRVITTKAGVREWSASGDSMEVPPVDVYPSPEVSKILSQEIAGQVKCYEVVGYRTKEDDMRCTLFYNCSSAYRVFAYDIAANSPVNRRFYLCCRVKENLGWGKDLFRSSEFVTGEDTSGATGANNLRVFGGRKQRSYGGICAIRLYNRELTEAEIAYNYLIDRLRFNF